jgi:hypothetical protein
MSKSKKSTNEYIKKSGKYLREISVVVIGVAITLSVSYWIVVQNEKRDMALHLRAIKMELQENAGDIGKLVETLKPACRYTAYLRSHDKKSLDKDSLNSYSSLCYAAPQNFTFKTNAFEMFKTSGTMRLMDDKDLLMEIWNAYDGILNLKEAVDIHNKLKWDFMEKEISLVDVDKDGKVEWDMIPMYDFYKKTGISNNLLNWSEIILKITHELYLKLMMMQLETSKLKTYQVTDEDLDKYLGVYLSDQVPVKLTITKGKKQLFGQLTGQLPFHLSATAKNKFEVDGITLEFHPTDKTIVVNRDGIIFNFVREEL